MAGESNGVSAAELAYQRAVRGQLVHALEMADLLLPAADYGLIRRQVMAEGARLWQKILTSLASPSQATRWLRAAREAGLGVQLLSRVLGFGYLQAHSFAAVPDLQREVREEAAELGALFNLAIALFDFVYDRYPALSPPLLDAVNSVTLAQMMISERETPNAHHAPLIDLLVTLVSNFLRRSISYPAGGSVRSELEMVINQMYTAEVTLASTTRAESAPTALLWRQLEQKSVLPMWTMALTSLNVGGDQVSGETFSLLRETAFRAGELVWIVDDLADAAEDWGAGLWSRPWFLWVQAGNQDQPLTQPVEDALSSLQRSGVVAADVRRLVHGLQDLQKIALIPGQTSPVGRCLQATVQSWIYGLPV